MSKTWLQSYPSSAKWDLLALKPEDIAAIDVAWHLSQVNRYTGGTRLPLSVAEHCVRVSRAVERCMRAANDAPDLERTKPVYRQEEIRLASLAALVHDASEAITTDLANPTKIALRMLTYEIIRKACAQFGGRVPPSDEEAPDAWRSFESPYDVLEDRIAKVMAERFGAPYPWPAIVKHFDLVVLCTEKRDLLNEPPERWNLPDEIKPLDETVEAWAPERARAEWLARLSELGGTP